MYYAHVKLQYNKYIFLQNISISYMYFVILIRSHGNVDKDEKLVSFEAFDTEHLKFHKPFFYLLISFASHWNSHYQNCVLLLVY